MLDAYLYSVTIIEPFLNDCTTTQKITRQKSKHSTVFPVFTT